MATAAKASTAKKPAARKPSSGVKSESTREAGQIRALKDRLDRLEDVCRALSRGNLETAQEALDSHL